MYRDLYAEFSRRMPTTERTFIAVKPDGVQRGLVAKIIAKFEERGYKLVGLKMMHASKEHLKVGFCWKGRIVFLIA